MSDLLDVVAADVADVHLTDFAEAVTIDGVTVQAIVLDDFESADPRAPVLRVAEADITSAALGDAVVVRGVNYTVEFHRPGRFGMAEIGLTAL